MVVSALIDFVINLAGTVCTIERAGTPSLISGTTEYDAAFAPVYTDLPCRVVEQSPSFDLALPGGGEMAESVFIFHVPALFNASQVDIDPERDRIIFENNTYEIIRVVHPSGGSLTGSQLSYHKLYARKGT